MICFACVLQVSVLLQQQMECMFLKEFMVQPDEQKGFIPEPPEAQSPGMSFSELQSLMMLTVFLLYGLVQAPTTEPTKMEPTMETQQVEGALVYSSSHTQMECRHFTFVFIYIDLLCDIMCLYTDSGLGPVST